MTSIFFRDIPVVVPEHTMHDPDGTVRTFPQTIHCKESENRKTVHHRSTETPSCTDRSAGTHLRKHTPQNRTLRPLPCRHSVSESCPATGIFPACNAITAISEAIRIAMFYIYVALVHMLSISTIQTFSESFEDFYRHEHCFNAHRKMIPVPVITYIARTSLQITQKFSLKSYS